MTALNHSSSRPLRILYLGTKPAYPPKDGGRLLMWNTIVSLAARGHRITFVAPDLGYGHREIEEHLTPQCAATHLVPARIGGNVSSFVRAMCSGRPLSVVRHSQPAVRRRIEEILTGDTFDVLHVEQIQALSNLPHSVDLPPVVLRAQNVESQLWRMVAQVRPRMAWFARREARRMAAHEALSVERVATTITLTERDGKTLAGASGMVPQRIKPIRPPFPANLDTAQRGFEGHPSTVLIAGGWMPNRDSTRWFFSSVWDTILKTSPGAHVHVFGGGRTPSNSAPATSWHGTPSESIEMFHSDSILVVPLRVASGIRMKILEAWARGVPVVATPEAVRGLAGSDGQAFLLARSGVEFASAVRRIHLEPELRRRLVVAGRRVLETHHDPTTISETLEFAYLEASERPSSIS